MSAGPPAPDQSATPLVPPESPGLLLRVRGHLSLSRVQAIFGLIAALLSIGGALYGYLRPGRAPHTGDVVAIVQEARSGKPVTDATVEILMSKDALVTTLLATSGEARSQMKEGDLPSAGDALALRPGGAPDPGDRGPDHPGAGPPVPSRRRLPTRPRRARPQRRRRHPPQEGLPLTDRVCRGAGPGLARLCPRAPLMARLSP